MEKEMEDGKGNCECMLARGFRCRRLNNLQHSTLTNHTCNYRTTYPRSSPTTYSSFQQQLENSGLI